MKSFLLLLPLIVLLLGSCGKEQHKGSMVIEQVQLLDTLPSGSALTFFEEKLFIIGDDAPCIFLTDTTVQYIRQLCYPELGERTQYRTSKQNKMDLEASSVVQWEGRPWLLALGSGTVSPQREHYLLVRIDSPQVYLDGGTGHLYEEIRRQNGLAEERWNLEGLVTVGDSLYLLNRGTNEIIITESNTLLRALTEQSVPPGHRILKLELPQIAGKTPKVSGGANGPSGTVLFTASIEDTEVWHQDGEVIGSGIGALEIATGRLLWFYPLTSGKGVLLTEKLESLELLDRSDEELRILAIADNDDGSSKLFWIRVALP